MLRNPGFAVLVACFILTAPPVVHEASAQSSDQSSVRHAQVFVSTGAKVKRLGGSRSVLHFGFGVEWRHPIGVGLAVEAGPRFEDHEFGRFDDVMISIDGSYRLRFSSKLMPFVDGGYAIGWEPVPDGQQTSFASVGGGVMYRLNLRREIRFELRDAVTLGEPQTGYHYLAFRVGYAWQLGGT